MIEEGIAKDLSMVVENAKLMGCQEVKSFKNIPLKNVEAVISALQKQIAKKPEDERCFIKDKENIGLCPSCGISIHSTARVETRTGHLSLSRLRETHHRETQGTVMEDASPGIPIKHPLMQWEEHKKSMDSGAPCTIWIPVRWMNLSTYWRENWDTSKRKAIKTWIVRLEIQEIKTIQSTESGMVIRLRTGVSSLYHGAHTKPAAST